MMLSFFRCATATHDSIISEQGADVNPLFLFVVYNFYSRISCTGKKARARRDCRDEATMNHEQYYINGVWEFKTTLTLNKTAV